MPKSKGFTEEDLKRMGLSEVQKGVFAPIPKSNVGSNVHDVMIGFKKHAVIEYTPAVLELDEFTFLNKSARPIAVFNITPIGAPRMTKSDTWKLDPFDKDPRRRQRKPVTQYFKFKNEIQAQALQQNFTLPECNFHVIFILPMPHSWAEKKKNQMKYTPHQQKPDSDNMIKAVKDSLCKNDANIWDYRITKYWGVAGKILIYSP